MFAGFCNVYSVKVLQLKKSLQEKNQESLQKSSKTILSCLWKKHSILKLLFSFTLKVGRRKKLVALRHFIRDLAFAMAQFFKEIQSFYTTKDN